MQIQNQRRRCPRVTMVTPRIVYIPRLYRAACAFLFSMRFCPRDFCLLL